ncbi:hypothetical protein [Vibrio sp. NH-UV-68]|uniref:hypothetical protein n=1 Tax=unclassified Vibrio TaxID=2614977 RepID=UPI0036F28ECD
MSSGNSRSYTAWCNFKAWSYRNDTNKNYVHFYSLIVAICGLGMLATFVLYPLQHIIPQLWASGVVASITLFDLFWYNYEHRKGTEKYYSCEEKIFLAISLFGVLSVVFTGGYYAMLGRTLPSGLVLLFTLTTVVGLFFVYRNCSNSFKEAFSQNTVVVILTGIGLFVSGLSYFCS